MSGAGPVERATGEASGRRSPGDGVGGSRFETTIEVAPDHEASSRRAAEIIARAVAKQPAPERFAFVIPGGSGPRRLFELLAEGFPDPLPWSRIHVFWSDERCVPPDDPQSNYGAARRLLLSRAPVPESNVHRILGEASPAEAAAAYRRELSEFFGAALPAFDLALLGLGRDGHTCSLFPGSPLLQSDRAVEPADSPEGVRHRVTLTPAALAGCRTVVFLVSGAEKARPVAETLEGPEEPGRFPARAIRPDGGRVLWLLDAAAASALGNLRPEGPPGARLGPPPGGSGRSR